MTPAKCENNRKFDGANFYAVSDKEAGFRQQSNLSRLKDSIRFVSKALRNFSFKLLSPEHMMLLLNCVEKVPFSNFEAFKMYQRKMPCLCIRGPYTFNRFQIVLESRE